jgi:hypothetical protein
VGKAKFTKRILVPKIGDTVIWWIEKELPRRENAFLYARIVSVRGHPPEGYWMTCQIFWLSERCGTGSRDPFVLIDLTTADCIDIIPKQNGFLKALLVFKKLQIVV